MSQSVAVKIENFPIIRCNQALYDSHSNLQLVLTRRYLFLIRNVLLNFNRILHNLRIGDFDRHKVGWPLLVRDRLKLARVDRPNRNFRFVGFGVRVGGVGVVVVAAEIIGPVPLVEPWVAQSKSKYWGRSKFWYLQCDQNVRNFATLAQFKSLGQILQGLFCNWTFLILLLLW